MSSINTNLASLYAQKNMAKLDRVMPVAVERLSSGLRINRAKDDAAGLGISEKIQTQIKATTQSMKNANDAISMVQAAEGSLAEVSSMLQRMKELTIQGRNGSYNTSQRKTLTDEIFALRDEINLVAERTTFNGLSLLKSSLNTSAAVNTSGIGALATIGNASATNIVSSASAAISQVVTNNANVGKYTVESTSGAITVTAIQSTTGLTSVSQTISFADLVKEEQSNLDTFSATTLKLEASATVDINFDRLGIKFVVTERNGSSASITGFATGYSVGLGGILQIDVGTAQAAFQAGANTRDSFNVTGFKDIRIFDRNLLGDDQIQVGTDEQKVALQDEFRKFSRLNDTLKTMAPQTEAVLSATNFTDLANRLEEVIASVTEIRSGLGAQNNRIEFAIGNIQAQTENMTAAMGRIRDTDFAAETANLTRLQILQQAATAMLSQANQMPNVVLSLLR
jgi:flagellin